MMPKNVIYLLVIALAINIASCGSQYATGQPNPLSSTSYPLNSIDKHGQTAFEAYPRAKEEAFRWNEEAILYQIPPTRLMESNLGLGGKGPAGWFFMFKTPDSPVEFYIEIVDGALYGKTEAQPILFEEPSYRLKPIDLDDNILDSDMALEAYFRNGGEKYFSKHPDVNIDYRLIHLEGADHPVWSIFDSADLVNALIHIDAVTGQVTQDPFEQVINP